MARRSRGSDDGVVLLEALLSAAIAVAVMAAVLAVVSTTQSQRVSQEEQADLQQRVRVASDVLFKSLLMAGAGGLPGEPPLGSSTAVVLPYRRGAQRGDGPGAFRADTLTVVRVPRAASPAATLARPLRAESGLAFVNVPAGCAMPCGFAVGMDVVVYDQSGASDTFRVASTGADWLQLQHTMPDGPYEYGTGSALVEVMSETFYTKADATGAMQLMRYDGVFSEAPIVDHLASWSVEYAGDPVPPVLDRPLTDPAGPWTTYGPKPPDETARVAGYPAGENCVFLLDGESLRHVSRLAALPEDPGDSGGAGLAVLSRDLLSDGPWCPHAGHPNRFDADLLRIRRVTMVVRFEAAVAAVRGPAGVLLAPKGSSGLASRWVPDIEVRVVVFPRNLGRG